MEAHGGASAGPDPGLVVSLTFDLDAEAPLLGRASGAGVRLGALSEARYGVRRALPRLLALLERERIRATFYVPGLVAEMHPHAIEALLAAGHELGHHGHRHLDSRTLSDAEQAAEVDDALDAFERLLGARPRGYRSPAWELTPRTAALLAERGFAFDSSLMEDDRPYRIQIGAATLVELPVHWSLDDWAYLSWTPDRPQPMAAPAAALSAWADELASAAAERRHVTFTMHPEVIGRGQRAVMLERLVEAVRRHGGTFAAHGDVAAAAARAHDLLGEPVWIGG